MVFFELCLCNTNYFVFVDNCYVFEFREILDIFCHPLKKHEAERYFDVEKF